MLATGVGHCLSQTMAIALVGELLWNLFCLYSKEMPSTGCTDMAQHSAVVLSYQNQQPTWCKVNERATGNSDSNDA